MGFYVDILDILLQNNAIFYNISVILRLDLGVFKIDLPHFFACNY